MVQDVNSLQVEMVYKKATSLKELYMDNGEFYFRDQNKSYDFCTIFQGGTDYKPHLRLFCLCPAKLERVSIRNATMKYLFLYDRATPLSFQHQEKLIRSLSSDLRWFQGEDQQSNMLKLRAEYTKVKFSSCLCRPFCRCVKYEKLEGHFVWKEY